MRAPRALACALAVAAAAAACGGSGGDGQLTVFAAASLSGVFPRIDPQARFNFAGSDDLAAQIVAGARAEVFAAASPKYPEELFTKGIVEKPRVFATNRLVLIVPKANRAGVRSVRDLERPGIKVVVGAQGVPVGDYTRKALAAMGASAALRNVVSEEPDVKGVVAKVATGAADAGFVYVTDARAVAGQVLVVQLPAAAQPQVDYEIAVVRHAAHPAAARAFVARVLGAEGRHELAAAGFGLP